MKEGNETNHVYACKDVGHQFVQGKCLTTALEEVTLNIPEFKLTAFCGPSGSGKSTLLALLGLIEDLQKGEIKFFGKSLIGLSESEKNKIRRNDLGFVFQQFHLFDTLSALENVGYFLKDRPITSTELAAMVGQCLEVVGLTAHAHKRPLELSGGQRQRVAIARALAKSPRVIVADELTASLDQKTGREIMEFLKSLVQQKKATVIIASHDPMALEFADVQIKLKDGRLDQYEEKKA